MTPTKLHPQPPSRQCCSSVSQHLSISGGISGAISGGSGSGELFIPILTLVAGYELRTASTLSAFMISAGSIANVICNFAIKFIGPGSGGINFDIALLLEPMMLLGVSIMVIWNDVFPEWLITAMFVAFLVWSTVKTCLNGVVKWKSETEETNRSSWDKSFGDVEPLLGWEEDCEWKAVGSGGDRFRG
ncbi:Sulfite exporter TauE/SafE family protein 2 [Linum perenne]